MNNGNIMLWDFRSKVLELARETGWIEFTDIMREGSEFPKKIRCINDVLIVKSEGIVEGDYTAPDILEMCRKSYLVEPAAKCKELRKVLRPFLWNSGAKSPDELLEIIIDLFVKDIRNRLSKDEEYGSVPDYMKALQEAFKDIIN